MRIYFFWFLLLLPTLSYGNDMSIPVAGTIWSLLPPLIAIVLAFFTRKILFSLFIGVVLGVALASDLSIGAILLTPIRIFGFLWEVLVDSGHLSIIIFSLLIGGMVGIITQNGGVGGMMNRLASYATTKKKALIFTWLSGLIVFFDDYANTILVGNSMRPLTDKFKISREKLAYIVDSTAAPVASIAFITTWVGAELGYIEAATATISVDESAFIIFVKSLQYAFYPVFTLIFIYILIATNRDFGPMAEAEEKARLNKSEHFNKTVDIKIGDWKDAFVPISTLFVVVLVVLFFTGVIGSKHLGSMSWIQMLATIMGNANSYLALVFGALAGVVSAGWMSKRTSLFPNRVIFTAFLGGVKSLSKIMVILILAWCIAEVTNELGTAYYLVSHVTDLLSPFAMPAVLFLVAAGISFSTGSSWGTMAIAYPMFLPFVWSLCMVHGLPTEVALPIYYHSISVILAGSVFGDHCSPISDTTILSSMASGCDHNSHVKTQLPYAVMVGAVSVVISEIAVSFNFPWVLNYLLGIGLLLIIVRFLPGFTTNKH